MNGTRPGKAGPTGLQSPAAPCALRLLISKRSAQRALASGVASLRASVLRMKLRRVYAGFLLAAVLAGCKPEIRIAVASATLPQPRFTLTMDGEDRPRFIEGEVRDASGTIVWAFEAIVAGINSGAGELVYGETPEGFITIEGAEPLEAGRTYTLFVAGKGDGRASFVPLTPE